MLHWLGDHWLLMFGLSLACVVAILVCSRFQRLAPFGVVFFSVLATVLQIGACIGVVVAIATRV